MASVPRERFVAAEDLDRAYADCALRDRSRADDLPALHGGRDLRAARALGRRARPRGRYRFGLRRRGPGRARGSRDHDRARARARGARPRDTGRRRLCRRRGRRRRRIARGAGAIAVSRHLPSRRRRRALPTASTRSCRPVGVSSSRSARAQTSASCSSSGAPKGRPTCGRCPAATCPCSAPRVSIESFRLEQLSTEQLSLEQRPWATPGLCVRCFGYGPASGWSLRRARRSATSRARVNDALRRRHNWEQLLRFCLVGASGYAVNLAVYALLVEEGRRPLHPRRGEARSSSRSTQQLHLNRHWTFRAPARATSRIRGCASSSSRLVTLGANIAILRLLVSPGSDKITAQAIAIVVVTPLNFVGNKLWSFRRR